MYWPAERCRDVHCESQMAKVKAGNLHHHTGEEGGLPKNGRYWDLLFLSGYSLITRVCRYSKAQLNKKRTRDFVRMYSTYILHEGVRVGTINPHSGSQGSGGELRFSKQFPQSNKRKNPTGGSETRHLCPPLPLPLPFPT